MDEWCSQHCAGLEMDLPYSRNSWSAVGTPHSHSPLGAQHCTGEKTEEKEGKESLFNQGITRALKC